MPTRYYEHPDGTIEWFVDSDDLFAASMLESEGAPQLTVEEFDELVSALGEKDQGEPERLLERPAPRKAPRKRRTPRVYD